MRLHPAKTILFNLIWFLGSCAPLFSDMQGARLVGKRQFEITPGYSSVGIADEGVANYLGFQAAYGLSENVDLRLRFEHSWLKQSYSGESGNDIKFNFAGIGPKINLAKTGQPCSYRSEPQLAIYNFSPHFCSLYQLYIIRSTLILQSNISSIFVKVAGNRWSPLTRVWP